MNRIKELRIQRNLTQDEMGKIINVQKSAVSKYELGRAVPSTDVLKKLANYFNVSTDYLLGLSDQPQGTGFQKELLVDINGDSPDGGWQNMSLDDDDLLDAETQKLLTDYRQLDEKARETIKNMIEISLRKKAPLND